MTLSNGSMAARRSVVDYALARRATLASLQAGRTTLADVCDAHPYLLRAAKHHGEPTEDRCPICRKTNVTQSPMCTETNSDSTQDGSSGVLN